MKRIIISFVLLSFCFVLSSCKERTLDDIMKDGKIIVATNAEFPPFEYLDVKQLQLVLFFFVNS